MARNGHEFLNTTMTIKVTGFIKYSDMIFTTLKGKLIVLVKGGLIQQNDSD